MQLFAPLYAWTIKMAQHRYAPRYLAGLSFAESSFFPVPPDVMLAPMCLSNNAKALNYAMIATLFSVIGGMFGYMIGAFAFDLIDPWLSASHYAETYEKAVTWFGEWGIWVVLIAGFSPIPYKIFTIAAGAVGMLFFPFIIASFVGRGMRFFAVALIIKWGGAGMEATLRRYVEYLGWLLVIAILVIVIVW